MEHLYIALDFPNWNEAQSFINTYGFHGMPVKIGKELFYKEGPALIEALKAKEHPIFLDLKLHDIPNTVMRAMENLAQFGVELVNVHATGGREMILAAKEGLARGSSSNEDQTKLIAVTILTSFEEQTLQRDLKINDSLTDYVFHLAELSKDSGADGVVCSVHEAQMIKQRCGSSFLTVTPGIRLKDNKQDDQKRIATPSYARKHGADVLVVGRSITQAKDPRLAFEQIRKEWLNEDE